MIEKQQFSWQSTPVPILLVFAVNISTHACELTSTDNLKRTGCIELLWSGVPSIQRSIHVVLAATGARVLATTKGGRRGQRKQTLSTCSNN